jgi:hypothetical protein
VPIIRRALLMPICAAMLAVMTPARVAAQAVSGPSAALEAWVEAFNSRDPKRIVARYAPNAVLWGTTAKTIATTPAQIWDYFKDAGKRPTTRVLIDSTVERVTGDVAILSGAYTFVDVTDGVSANIRPARYSIVLQKIGDAWLIVDHHSSRVPQP